MDKGNSAHGVANVTIIGEPSDAAWHRFGNLAAAALARLAERDALAADQLAVAS